MATPQSDPRTARLGQELSSAVVLFHDALGRRLGLPAQDHRALALVEARGPLTAGELGRLTALTPGAVTALVDRLEQRGLAQRERAADDRRRVHIRATGTLPEDVTRVLRDLSAEIAEPLAHYDQAQWTAVEGFVTAAVDALRRQTLALSGQEP